MHLRYYGQNGELEKIVTDDQATVTEATTTSSLRNFSQDSSLQPSQTSAGHGSDEGSVASGPPLLTPQSSVPACQETPASILSSQSTTPSSQCFPSSPSVRKTLTAASTCPPTFKTTLAKHIYSLLKEKSSSLRQFDNLRHNLKKGDLKNTTTNATIYRQLSRKYKNKVLQYFRETNNQLCKKLLKNEWKHKI